MTVGMDDKVVINHHVPNTERVGGEGHFCAWVAWSGCWVPGLSTGNSWKLPNTRPIELSSFPPKKATRPKYGNRMRLAHTALKKQPVPNTATG